MPSNDPPLLSWRGLGREFTRYLPIWFVYLEAVGLLHASLANFPQQSFDRLGLSRAAFAPTVLFPLAWVGLFFVLRLKRSLRVAMTWKTWSALALLLVGVPLVVVFFHQPYPLTHDQLTLMFEASQFLWVGLLALQIVLSRGWQALLLFFGVTFAYGLLLENTGIVMHYFFEPSFRLYLGPLPAPLCTMLGWCVVFYVTIAVVQQLAEWVPWLKASVWRRTWATTLLALSLDAQLDPLASMSGVFWRWNDALPPAFLGVPVINYAAWFGAFLPYSWFVYAWLDRVDLTERERNWQIFLRVSLASLLGGLLCFGIMALAEGGVDGPTFQILTKFSDRLMPY